MTIRALLVAIENYDAAIGLTKKLDGTTAAGNAFRDWLIDVKKIDPANIRYCVADGTPGRTAGTTLDEIFKELKALVAAGRDDTTELYVFFSGHGFAFEDRSLHQPADVIAASELTSLGQSTKGCIKLRELQSKLRIALGPGEHYYFVDACRNIIKDDGQTDIPPITEKLGQSKLGQGCLFTLFSTVRGQKAAVDDGFARSLIAGLKGAGRAKGWQQNKMQVSFNLLLRYLRDSLRQEADGNPEGCTDGIILSLDPAPVSKCHVQVENADPADDFTLLIYDSRRFGKKDFQFQGSTFATDVPPEDYIFEVRHPTAMVVRIDPPEDPVNAFDDCTLRFRKQDPEVEIVTRGAMSSVLNTGVPPPTLVRVSEISFATPRGEDVVAVDLQRMTEQTLPAGTRPVLLGPGAYRFSVLENGVAVRALEMQIAPGEVRNIDLTAAETSTLRESIQRATKNPPGAPVVEFSETLGWMSNRDVGLWLSLMGASRIFTNFRLHHHLEDLPLATFIDLNPGDTAVYVLAGFESRPRHFQVAFGHDEKPTWQQAGAVQGMDGVFHRRLEAEVGPGLLSFQIGDHPPTTIATHCLPSRVTLVTVNRNDDGTLELHQYMLPASHLIGSMDEKVRQQLEHEAPLPWVRMMWQAQHEFAWRRELSNNGNPEFWSNFLYGKWLDPVMALLGAYEMIRRGNINSAPHVLDEAIRNLRLYFAGIPDIEVIAALCGAPATAPETAPLILDGLFAWQELQHGETPGASKLTYRGPWTEWRAMVEAVRKDEEPEPQPAQANA